LGLLFSQANALKFRQLKTVETPIASKAIQATLPAATASPLSAIFQRLAVTRFQAQAHAN